MDTGLPISEIKKLFCCKAHSNTKIQKKPRKSYKNQSKKDLTGFSIFNFGRNIDSIRSIGQQTRAILFGVSIMDGGRIAIESRMVLIWIIAIVIVITGVIGMAISINCVTHD